MNFYTYIGKTREQFNAEYLETGLVDKQKHDEFPLDIYCYGRKAVYTDHWDEVTSKCRGIVVNRDTGDIVARPFEKFHNHGSSIAHGNLYNPVTEEMLKKQPVIWEKLDGFMCTMYRWLDKDYIASKGSFHSPHAKWATAWYRRNIGDQGPWPRGWTPVFEGLCPDLRIVVDYKDREELVLTAMIHIDTGVEMEPFMLEHMAAQAGTRGIKVPRLIDMTLERAREESMKEYRDSLGTDEGYVLTWYNADKRRLYAPPARLKMKFIDYLRLHRMVCGVTPWRIWEALSGQNQAQMAEWMNKQNGTPWFEKFVGKWQRALKAAYAEHYGRATEIYEATVAAIGVRPGARFDADGNILRIQDLSPANTAVRKAFALEFTKPENKIYSAALFKMLDRGNASMASWKYVEKMTERSHPLRDAAQN